MKKFTSFLSVFFGLFIFNSFVVYAGSFPDVLDNHKNFQAIEYLYEKQIIQGYPDGTFGPESLVNRAEAAKMILGAFGVTVGDDYQESFPDVESDAWYFKYVMAGKDAGIINGHPDGNFKPGDSVNLAESLKMNILAGELTLFKEMSEEFYTDVALDTWYAPYLYYARAYNVILPDDYGAVHPDQDMTRAAFAEVVYRLMIVKERNQAPFPMESQWETYNGKELPFAMKYDSHKWIVVEKKGETVFLKPDAQYMQFSDTRVYPNTGLVKVVMDGNALELEQNQYVENIRQAFVGANYKEFNFGNFKALEVLYPKDKIVDWYIYLDNGDVLVVYTQYGDGILGYQLQQYIKAMLSTLSYQEVSGEPIESNADLLSRIFEKTLVEGAGVEILELLTDELIIETDAIGVGTGPVDYYYSATVNYTIKYERTSGTILDTSEGQTSAF